MAVKYDKLFSILKERNIKESELTKQAGFSGNIMTRIRRDEYVSLESIERICKVLGTRMDDILSFEEQHVWQVKDLDKLTAEQRHRNMQHIRNKDTSIEIKLRKALWHNGYRYQKNVKDLPGKPDIVLTKYHIVIFCDSEFFHGKDWSALQEQLKRGKNSEFWINKISQNMKRDDEVDKQLKALGWSVVRFWGKDISKNVEECVKTIEELIFEQKLQYED